ncbi:MAG: ABC transporter substrate-binding protein [Rhodoferax sp.]|jgi:ABC-type branched-subunit amino acid transport system substrate-binding protein|nr:ABC transporter substrate-binding protein [Rhodoferax sp.]
MKTGLKNTLAAALLSMGLASGAQAAGVSDTEIVLGTHLDLSGPVAAGMPSIRNGMQMRLDEANDAGGVNGRKFRLVVEDNGSQPQMAVRAMDKLIRSDEVFAVVNAFGSGANAAVVKRAVDAGVVYFGPWGASSIFRKSAGDSPLLFTVTPNYDALMNTGVGWMLDNYKPKKVGYIYQEGPLGALMGAGVKKALAAKGMGYAAEAGYKAGDIDFSSQVARMKAADVDMIVIATVTRETVGIMAEVKKLGWNSVKVVTGTPGRTGIVLQLGKDTVEGLYGVGAWKLYTQEDGPPAIKAWFANYKKKYTNEPDENALLAYYYTDMFVKSVQAVGRDLSADKLVKQLQGASFESPMFYDKVSFQNGHLMPEAVEIDQVQKGKWTAVSKTLR